MNAKDSNHLEMTGLNDNDNDEEEMVMLGDEDEELCEMLGLPSLSCLVETSMTKLETAMNNTEISTIDTTIPSSDSNIVSPYTPFMGDCEKKSIFDTDMKFTFDDDIRERLSSEGMIGPLGIPYSIPPIVIRRMVEELVRGADMYPSDQTHETITTIIAEENTQLQPQQQQQQQQNQRNMVRHSKHLTRLENFTDGHSGWSALCHVYLANLVSSILGEDMVLFKEKLNLKPPSGLGFAPHLDSPSLMVPFGKAGPRTFYTVMVAIDDMTVKNGCLRLQKGRFDEDNHAPLVGDGWEGNGKVDGNDKDNNNDDNNDDNPDGKGREGEIHPTYAASSIYDDLVCHSGNIAIFGGWTPHRSGTNKSPFHRRAVFLTYNPRREGEFHQLYHEKMAQIRNSYREKMMTKIEVGGGIQIGDRGKIVYVEP